ncbi:hypothetical protein ABZ807_09330 [Micromonospora sp. NPDC047548]|uniref:hypothetical protein n=1 Tax=Micromonospora sp. NPDC047548 TaxID=3155624 RepID=UPI0033EB4D31
MATTTSKLLADPTQIALVRDLYAHARKVRAEHAIYSYGNGLGQAMAPVEHTWTVGTRRVLVHDGWLLYLSHGAPLLKVQVDNVRQVGQLLAAIGVLPPEFAVPAVRPGQAVHPDRRCRYCAATSGLTMVHSSPLVLAPQEWECWDGCRDSAR